MKRLFKVLTLLFVVALLAVAPAAAFAEGAPDNGKPVSGLLPVAGALGLGAVAVGFATNYVGGEDTVTWTNDTSTAVASGGVVVLGSRCYIADGAIAVGATGTLHKRGAFELAAKAGEGDLPIGQIMYWDEGNAEATITASTHKTLGTLHRAKLTAATTCVVDLNA